MRSALVVSTALHLGVLIAGVVALPSVEGLVAPPVDSLPVELIPQSEITKLQLGSKAAKEIKEAAAPPTKKPAVDEPEVEQATGETNVEAPKPVEGEKPAQTASITEQTPPPEPEPALEPEYTASVETVPTPQAELGPDVEKAEEIQQVVSVRPRTKPKVRIRPKKQQEKPKFNPNDIAALLNKTTPTAAGAQKSQKVASLGSAQGQTNVHMSQSELDALRSQVAQCWNPPVGAPGAEQLVVKLQFNMGRSGEVEGLPRILNSNSNPAFGAASQSAIRAVYRCSPYSLPASKYEAWKTVILNFDPRLMLGY
ncbi:cell envelope integrity protein TolA [Flexibacterium corallicola]|uniref:cell envelope integrity protein TolA n=1 Tax=Flexibacterium corallicola TaxID=3037259 RepID=UPI00286EFD33|nr:cell envelope integrity protein TolA [Pseudovibrio sp. M1P-2-3]